MNIMVVTTFSQKNYDEYARRMIETFERYWDKSIRLSVYLNQDIELSGRADVRAFPAWFLDWRARHADHADAAGRDPRKNRPGREHDFRRDCLRFSYKVAAITDAAARFGGLLLWMDADIITFQEVNPEWLKETVHPAPSWMSWIDRKRVYPECGFMAFDMRNLITERFMKKLRDKYESDAVFKEKQTHDSYVIQQTVKDFQHPRSLNNLCGHDKHHPFPYIPLGQRLDHLKGNMRKRLGHSPERFAK